MENLAGDPNCDRKIQDELTRVEIPIVVAERPCGREVNTRLSGKLGAFTFTRSWYYYIATGPMPLEVAERLYATVVGAKDIRAGGHCGCPPPATQAKYYDDKGIELVSDPDGRQALQWSDFASKHPDWPGFKTPPRFVPDAPSLSAKAFVESFSIDSELGLHLFVAAVRDLPEAP